MRFGFRTFLVIAWSVAVLAVAVAAGLARLPFYGIGPGPAREVQPLIAVEGPRVYASSGRLVMTTVSYRQLTAIGVVLAWLDPDEAVVDESVLFPPGLTSEEEHRLAISDMDTSKINATFVALRELTGYPKEHGRGALIQGLVPGCSADGVLYPGDVVLDVNGRPVADVRAADRVIDDVPSGDTVIFTVRPLGESTTEDVRLVRKPCGASKEPLVGIARVPVFPFEVSIGSGDIGGPSAGLMFSLGLYDLLTPGDLTDGRTVAGTGTIGLDGRVGPIGGIEEKVVAAERTGAEVLLVPARNFAAALEVAPEGLELVEVGTFQDALDYFGVVGDRQAAA
ncbi:MAG: S16 family serine protease [Actinomycetota bacterium]